MKKIAVSVATRKRNEMLLRTLESLEQTKFPELFVVELIIADNDIEEGARDLVENFISSKFSAICYLPVSTLGIPFARNALLRTAIERQCDAIIFIDDDEVVDKTWLVELCEYFEKNDGVVHAIQGPVFPLFLKEPPPWLPVELYSTQFKLPTGSVCHVARTGNLLLDLSFVIKHNLFFDERMALSGGSDTEFTWRFGRKGGNIHWCNEARVFESISTARMDIRWLIKRNFRHGTSDALFWRLNHSRWQTSYWVIRRAVWNIIKCVAGFVLSGTNKSLYVKNFVRLFTSPGLILGLLGYTYKEYHPKRYR